ncbi:MAG: hypothetical protein GY754_46045 [bacterium]|nr:hypothetical protein [bacterium]
MKRKLFFSLLLMSVLISAIFTGCGTGFEDDTYQGEWSGTLQFGTDKDDIALGHAMDKDNNIYVAVQTEGAFDGNTNAGGADIALAKFNSAGVLQWVKQTGSTVGDYPRDIAIDESGNIYVTGYTSGDFDGNTSAGAEDIILVKYNANGEKQWSRQLGTTGIDFAFAMAVNKEGDIYLTGRTDGDLSGNAEAATIGTANIFLVKYNSSGEKLLTQQYGTSSTDEGINLAINDAGNVYITGYTGGALNGETALGLWDFFLIKVDSSDGYCWTKIFGTIYADEGYNIAIDSNNYIYIAGRTQYDLDGNTNVNGGASGTYDMFLAKYDSSGTWQWTGQWGSAGADSIGGLAISSDNTIYMGGYTDRNFEGNSNLVLLKSDTEKNVEWNLEMGGFSDDYSRDVSLDSSNNLFMVGHTTGGLDGNTNLGGTDVFIMKFDSSGALQ